MSHAAPPRRFCAVPRVGRRGIGRTLAVCATLWIFGCGGHAAKTKDVLSALDAGNPQRALAAVNKQLDVDTAAKLPEKVEGDNALFLLDRSMILQSIGSTKSAEGTPEEYEWSSRDLETADKQVELLDFSRKAIDEIGRYIFSDSTGPYKAPAYEKLMINTMNMVNYLVRGDLSGARVEARRLAIMQKFMDEHEDQGASLTAPGSYFAGFVFEKSGKPDEALHYYDDALKAADLQSLYEPIARLAQRASFRSPRIQKILDAQAAGDGPVGPPPENGEPDGAADDAAQGARDTESDPAAVPTAEPAEILVILQYGRVPSKYAKRIPIGLALTMASMWMSPAQVSKANYLAAQGLVTWINYPELGKPRGEYGRPSFALNGEWQQLEGVVAVDREAQAAWDKTKGAVIGSAITRLVTRILAGEGIRRAAGGGTLGAILSLGTQATLTAVDTPDTRSWATLPARIAVARVRVQPGTHWVDVASRGVKKRERITVDPGGWVVVNLTVLN